jgi:hypothetical protein
LDNKAGAAGTLGAVIVAKNANVRMD